MPPTLESTLSPENLALFAALDSPPAIQAFLDSVPYAAEYANRCPRRVLEDRKAHCLDGALLPRLPFAGWDTPPLIIDLLPEPGRDDDHVLALFHQNGRVGAIAKSNYVGLRYREPVYGSVRQLVMSYFEAFFNSLGEKTLRACTRVVNLSRFDELDWETLDSGADAIEEKLKHLHSFPLITPEMAARLSRVDKRSFDGMTLGIDPDGVYRLPEDQ